MQTHLYMIIIRSNDRPHRAILCLWQQHLLDLRNLQDKQRLSSHIVSNKKQSVKY